MTAIGIISWYVSTQFLLVVTLVAFRCLYCYSCVIYIKKTEKNHLNFSKKFSRQRLSKLSQTLISCWSVLTKLFKCGCWVKNGETWKYFLLTLVEWMKLAEGMKLDVSWKTIGNIFTSCYTCGWLEKNDKKPFYLLFSMKVIPFLSSRFFKRYLKHILGLINFRSESPSSKIWSFSLLQLCV